MKILVIGSGGREHALVWKLAQSDTVKKIYSAPGNAGISQNAECINIKADDIKSLVDFAKKNDIDLTIVGPEMPLVLGIVDVFTKEGLKIFGPSQKAARLEGSKVFSKQIMNKYGIPTAKDKIFDNINDAIAYVNEQEMPIVVKADGLAAGKGVIVCGSKQEAVNAIKSIMEERVFGEAGEKIIIEECLVGEEVSILAFSDGRNVVPLVPSQDHKRAYDGDMGPNTGGMGAYSPVPVLSDKLVDQIKTEVLEPTIKAMEEEGCPYKGILYAGLMLTDSGPKVLEYNVRFGDPETQVVLPRMKSDLVDPIFASIDGNLSECNISWLSDACVCVVVASGGYPGKYNKGVKINGLDRVNDAIVFHAGTKKGDNSILTNGGRVLGVTALGDSISSAAKKAYEAVGLIKFDNMQYRTDIAQKAFKGVNL